VVVRVGRVAVAGLVPAGWARVPPTARRLRRKKIRRLNGDRRETGDRSV
jgi:hypothetical protein